VLKSFAFTRILEQALENVSVEEINNNLIKNLSTTEWMKGKKDMHRSPTLNVADIENISTQSVEFIESESEFAPKMQIALDEEATS